MFGLGMKELVVVGLVATVLFGASQLPKLARAVGESIKEFRKVGKELSDGENGEGKDKTA